MPRRASDQSSDTPHPLRRDERHSLLLRTAKVICQSGEYAALVRDVSVGGVGLAFFHEPPPEERIFLELASGAIYPIERAWAAGQRTGYRFAQPVELAEVMEETSRFPHRAIRFRVQVPALVTCERQDSQAIVADISSRGARLVSEMQLPLLSFVRVEAPGLPLRFGHICWRKGRDHGVSFQESIPLRELAESLFALAPYDAGPIVSAVPEDAAIRAA